MIIEILAVIGLGVIGALWVGGGQESEPDVPDESASVRNEERVESVCPGGVCMPHGHNHNLTGWQPRTQEEESLVQRAMEWTDADQRELAAGYRQDQADREEVARIVQGREWENVDEMADVSWRER